MTQTWSEAAEVLTVGHALGRKSLRLFQNWWNMLD
jgi:hypothetical protein